MELFGLLLFLLVNLLLKVTTGMWFSLALFNFLDAHWVDNLLIFLLANFSEVLKTVFVDALINVLHQLLSRMHLLPKIIELDLIAVDFILVGILFGIRR